MFLQGPLYHLPCFNLLAWTPKMAVFQAPELRYKIYKSLNTTYSNYFLIKIKICYIKTDILKNIFVCILKLSYKKIQSKEKLLMSTTWLQHVFHSLMLPGTLFDTMSVFYPTTLATLFFIVRLEWISFCLSPCSLCPPLCQC